MHFNRLQHNNLLYSLNEQIVLYIVKLLLILTESAIYKQKYATVAVLLADKLFPIIQQLVIYATEKNVNLKEYQSFTTLMQITVRIAQVDYDALQMTRVAATFVNLLKFPLFVDFFMSVQGSTTSNTVNLIQTGAKLSLVSIPSSHILMCYRSNLINMKSNQ